VPVVVASALIAAVCVSSGRLTTHCRRASRFLGVWDVAPKPRMQRWPSQKTELMAARLVVESSLRDEMMATGVPK